MTLSEAQRLLRQTKRKKCRSAAAYKGIRPPRCNPKCAACLATWIRREERRQALGVDRMTEALEWLNAALDVEQDACLIWPFPKEDNGYARVQLTGERVGAHAFICRHAHGPAPSPEHEVAHSCGRRVCCNKRHVRWATSQENNQEKIRHGTIARGRRNPRARLTEDEVRAIRVAPGYLREIADKYGISISGVYHVRAGHTWAWLT